jgi:dipeptidyl aminopeptidase/acylaminoacyl peptidase
VQSAPDDPGEVIISPAAAYVPRTLTRTNAQVRARAQPRWEVVRWRNGDVEVEGLLFTPAGRPPFATLVQMEGTYGTYDLSYTGRASADDNTLFPFQQHLFAAAGFAVLMPNPRGSWGYGQTFRELGATDPADGPTADVLAGVDALVQRGIADRDRLGILGTWYDGYRAAYAITTTDRFRAASLGNAFWNVSSWFGQLGPDREIAERLFAGPPWEQPARYTHLSPAFRAANLKTPALIFYTEGTPAFPAMQAVEIETAYRRAGVPFETRRYPAPGFGGVRPSEFQDVVNANLRWFQRWLSAPGASAGPGRERGC